MKTLWVGCLLLMGCGAAESAVTGDSPFEVAYAESEGDNGVPTVAWCAEGWMVASGGIASTTGVHVSEPIHDSGQHGWICEAIAGEGRTRCSAVCVRR
jgi:hypothetical protein